MRRAKCTGTKGATTTNHQLYLLNHKLLFITVKLLCNSEFYCSAPTPPNPVYSSFDFERDESLFYFDRRTISKNHLFERLPRKASLFAEQIGFRVEPSRFWTAFLVDLLGMKG